MIKMKKQDFWMNEEGQSMVEYGVTLGAIAAVSYIAVVQLGDKTADLYSWMANHLPGGEDDEAGTANQVRIHAHGLTPLSGNAINGASFSAEHHLEEGHLKHVLGGSSSVIEDI